MKNNSIAYEIYFLNYQFTSEVVNSIHLLSNVDHLFRAHVLKFVVIRKKFATQLRVLVILLIERRLHGYFGTCRVESSERDLKM